MTPTEKKEHYKKLNKRLLVGLFILFAIVLLFVIGSLLNTSEPQEKTETLYDGIFEKINEINVKYKESQIISVIPPARAHITIRRDSHANGEKEIIIEVQEREE